MNNIPPSTLDDQKPTFSTIRKAIKGASEEMASKEFLSWPEQRHVDYIIDLYRTLKDLQPEAFDKMVIITAKGKEIKDELGPDLHKLFDQVWNEIAANLKNDIEDAMINIRKTKQLNSEELENEIQTTIKRYLQAKADLLKKDPRIISAFSGKEDLLNKALAFIFSSLDFALSFSQLND